MRKPNQLEKNVVFYPTFTYPSYYLYIVSIQTEMGASSYIIYKGVMLLHHTPTPCKHTPSRSSRRSILFV